MQNNFPKNIISTKARIMTFLVKYIDHSKTGHPNTEHIQVFEWSLTILFTVRFSKSPLASTILYEKCHKNVFLLLKAPSLVNHLKTGLKIGW
jgi:hypothetical protein